MNNKNEYIHLNYGPHSAPTIGPVRVGLKLSGDLIVSAELHRGYAHRGIEKLAERMTWHGLMPFMERVDYLAPMSCSLAYALAIEALIDIKITQRAKDIRMAVCELNRVSSHMYSLASLASRLGATTVAMYLIRDREKINNLFEALCGARVTYNYIRIGGVAFDITEGFKEKTFETIEYIKPKLSEYECLLIKNPIFIGRLEGVGTLEKSRALECSLTGPNLRASGVDFDTRKSGPYSGYEAHTSVIGSSKHIRSRKGDALARVQERIAEIDESLIMVQNILEKIDLGQFRVPYNISEGVPVGASYACVESPRGNFGVYVCSNGGKSPDRIKIKSPSAAAAVCVPQLLKGCQASDVNAIVGSFDISMSEVDR